MQQYRRERQVLQQYSGDSGGLSDISCMNEECESSEGSSSVSSHSPTSSEGTHELQAKYYDDDNDHCLDLHGEEELPHEQESSSSSQLDDEEESEEEVRKFFAPRTDEGGSESGDEPASESDGEVETTEDSSDAEEQPAHHQRHSRSSFIVPRRRCNFQAVNSRSPRPSATAAVSPSCLISCTHVCVRVALSSYSTNADRSLTMTDNIVSPPQTDVFCCKSTLWGVPIGLHSSSEIRSGRRRTEAGCASASALLRHDLPSLLLPRRDAK